MRTAERDSPPRLDTDVSCVLTRFQFKSPRGLLRMRRRFHAVATDARQLDVPGLRQSVLLIESPRACFSLSIWDAFPAFSAHVPSHIDAANRVFGSLAFNEAGPQLWSTSWQLTSVSNNLNWPGLDLTAAIASGSPKGPR